MSWWNRFKKADACVADRDFHCFLLEMSGNEIITSLSPLIQAFFQESHRIDDGSEGIGGMVHCEWHMRYVHGIRDKDVEALRKEVEQHHNSYIKFNLYEERFEVNQLNK